MPGGDRAGPGPELTSIQHGQTLYFFSRVKGDIDTYRFDSTDRGIMRLSELPYVFDLLTGREYWATPKQAAHAEALLLQREQRNLEQLVANAERSYEEKQAAIIALCEKHGIEISEDVQKSLAQLEGRSDVEQTA